MDKQERSKTWKMHLPEFKHSRRNLIQMAKDNESDPEDGTKDRFSQHKSVTMAPMSRYLTDRQYVMRRPLFAAEQHTSILKKRHPQKHTGKEKHASVSEEEENQLHTDTNSLSRTEDKLTPESFRLSHSDSLTPSVSREDIDSPPMGVSELRSRLFNEEPTFGSSLPGSRLTQRSLSSSFLEVQRLNPPLRPRLTSTVLHPTYTPLSGKSRRDQTNPRLGVGEERGGRGNKLQSSRENSTGKSMSRYQEDYWSCAIPKSLPPSPDRHSADWDPNREYQALLDYTYPLRPGEGGSEWDTTELHRDYLLQTDKSLQDSGIELDRLCSSSPISGLGHRKSRGTGSVGQMSPDQHATESSGGPLCSTLLSIIDPVGLSSDSLDSRKNKGGMNNKRDARCHQYHALSSISTSAAFGRPTCILPRSKCTCWDTDDEFWPLPDQLEELQLLSRQVREVTAQLSRPVTASWESLEPGTTSLMSSISLPGRKEAEDKKLTRNNGGTDKGKDETDIEETSAVLADADFRESEAWRTSTASADGGGLSLSSLREVETLAKQLSGLTLPSSHRNLEEQRQADSLLHHIKVFCSHLEQLIRRLYAVSEKMELLTAPIVDIDGVKSSLAEYQSFQREVSSHQPLVSSVLQTGRLLLSCINTTSPLLRDTLLLIERQSGALENHTEHFFSSILSAMDNLTQPSPVQQSRAEEASPVRISGST